MEKAFDQGRRYERKEVVEMLEQIQKMPTEQFKNILATWEQELKESLVPKVKVVEDTIVVYYH